MTIDPRAVVSDEAELAADVVVGPYAVIGAGVRLGAGCRIGPHAVINGPTTMGCDNVVYQFASLGDAPQDKKYRGEETRLEIGDRNVFREGCTVNRGTVQDRGVTRIGNDGWFMATTHIAHDCQIGDNVIMANLATLGGHVEIGDWVIVAGFSGVHQFCRIGAHAFVGNNSSVTKDVPPYLMVSGRPAAPVGINTEGLRRRGFSPEQLAGIKRAYRLLYRSGLRLAEATVELQRLVAVHPEVQAVVDFLPRSSRSIVR
ncbi:MAG: acyl-ACP--UDP-N-acetylglucosamine O-acyltransferase [Gammaproteobacteria bacterium]|nr:acyl-ACP--UDP-N-acetylglucosamine O-acyltransferase [Gammaproteobacteria bacterium]